jgi:hypothetical protein
MFHRRWKPEQVVPAPDANPLVMVLPRGDQYRLQRCGKGCSGENSDHRAHSNLRQELCFPPSVITSKPANDNHLKTGQRVTTFGTGFSTPLANDQASIGFVSNPTVLRLIAAPRPVGKCGKRFLLSNQLWESSRRNSRRHLIDFHQLGHFPQAFPPFLLFPVSLGLRHLRFGPPTPGPAFENVTMMQESVEHCRNGGGIAEQFAPVFHRSIGGE